MVLALFAKLIVKSLPSLSNHILHQIPTEMCKARIRADLERKIANDKYKNNMMNTEVN